MHHPYNPLLPLNIAKKKREEDNEITNGWVSDTYSDVPALHQGLRDVVDIHSIKFDSISTRWEIKVRIT